MNRINVRIVGAAALLMVIHGCASTPMPNAALENAKMSVQAAESDPNVARYAALDLQAAKNQLTLAETAQINHDDRAVDQPAYLAGRYAKLAQLNGAAKADDARVAAGQTERQQIELAARNRELEAAKLADAQAAAKAAALKAQVDALKSRN